MKIRRTGRNKSTEHGALGESSRLFRTTVEQETRLGSGHPPTDGPDCSSYGQETLGRTF